MLERVRKVVLADQHTLEAEVSGESGLLDELGDMGLRWQVRRIFVAEFDAESHVCHPQYLTQCYGILTFVRLDFTMSSIGHSCLHTARVSIH